MGEAEKGIEPCVWWGLSLDAVCSHLSHTHARTHAESLHRAGVHDVAGRVRHKEFLAVAAQEGALTEAFRFVRLIRPPDVRAFNLLLSACAQAGDADAACRAFRDLAAAGLRPDCLAFTTLISACAKAGQCDRAFEVFADMRAAGVAPTAITFGALTDALSRDIGRAAAAGDKRRVHDRLAQVHALTHELKASACEPDAVFFNSLVSACGRAAAVDKHALAAAFAAKREMVAAGLVPCPYTYSALIDGCTRAGDAPRGLALWEEYTTGFGTAGTSSSVGSAPPPELVGAAAHACAVTGSLDTAMTIYHDALAKGMRPDGVLFAILMDAAARSGDVEFAFALQDEMERVSVPPQAAVYATLIGICAREAQAARARTVFAAMRTAGVRPTASAINALVAAHARAGDVEGAFASLSELPAAGLQPDVTTYATLVGACARARDLERAWKVMQRCKEVGLQPPAEAYCALIAGHAASGQLPQALDAERQLTQAGFTLDAPTSRVLLIACAQGGDPTPAWHIWSSALEAGVTPSESMLNTLLGAVLQRVRQLEEDALFMYGASGAGDSGVGSPTALLGERREWERRAVAAYTDAQQRGVVPRVETLSTLLACLRQVQQRGPSRRIANATAHALSPAANAAVASARGTGSGGSTGGLYPERALVLFEEAQAAGVVPRFSLGGPCVIDLRPLPPAAAEVCVLTLLRVLRRRRVASGDSLKLFQVSLRVHDVAELMALTAGASRGVALRRARTGIRTAELLRRLSIPFTGQVAQGELALSEVAIESFLRSSDAPNRTAAPSVFAVTVPEVRAATAARGLPGTAARLPAELREQAKRIRMQD